MNFKLKNILIFFLLFFTGLFSIKILLHYINNEHEIFYLYQEAKEIAFIAIVISVLITMVNKIYFLKNDSR